MVSDVDISTSDICRRGSGFVNRGCSGLGGIGAAVSASRNAFRRCVEEPTVPTDRVVDRFPARTLDALEQRRCHDDTGLPDRSLPGTDYFPVDDDDRLEHAPARVDARRVLRVEDV